MRILLFVAAVAALLTGSAQASPRGEPHRARLVAGPGARQLPYTPERAARGAYFANQLGAGLRYGRHGVLDYRYATDLGWHGRRWAAHGWRHAGHPRHAGYGATMVAPGYGSAAVQVPDDGYGVEAAPSVYGPAYAPIASPCGCRWGWNF